MVNKSALWLAMTTIGFANTSQAMSVEQRRAAMEKKMAQMKGH